MQFIISWEVWDGDEIITWGLKYGPLYLSLPLVEDIREVSENEQVLNRLIGLFWKEEGW